MNIFENKKVLIILLSCVLLVMTVMLLFPNLFSFRKLSTGVTRDVEITRIETQSKDTSPDSIKKDLDDTDLTDIDKELESIQKEIDSSV